MWEWGLPALVKAYKAWEPWGWAWWAPGSWGNGEVMGDWRVCGQMATRLSEGGTNQSLSPSHARVLSSPSCSILCSFSLQREYSRGSVKATAV